MTLEIAGNFGLALLIGALVGLEREYHRRHDDAPTSLGLRSFMLVALAGALAAWLGQRLGSPWILAAVGAIVAAIAIVGQFSVRPTPDDEPGESAGLTTELAAVVVFLLGATVIVGDRALVVAVAIGTSAVLAYKRPLHAMVGRLDRDDLYAVIRLLVASFVVLPVLPDRPIDPWGVVNPYKTWLLVILISGLSLVGYVASRWLGPRRGIPLTGIVGGLVSSTAVSLAFARQGRPREDGRPEAGVAMADALAAGVVLAWAVMFVRVVVEVAVVNPALLSRVIWPMAVMGAASAAVAATLLLIARRSTRRDGEGSADFEVPLENPFSLTAAARFALFFLVVQALVELFRRTVPAEGLYAVAAVAGLTDVDAITLSMASFARGGGPAEAKIASVSIVLAAITNTAVKCGLVVVLGAAEMRNRVLAGTAVIIVAGLLALWLL